MPTMKSVQTAAPGTVEMAEIERPVPGPRDVLATVPEDVRSITELRNGGGSLDWATAWLRMTPQRLFSFAELAWQGVSPSS